MNRALPLLLFAILAAGGLAFFALSEGRGPAGPADSEETASSRRTNGPAKTAAVAPEEESQLAAPAAVVRKPRPQTNGNAKWLEIWPMNELGQPLNDAQVVAEGPGVTLEAKGRIRWDDVQAGEWTITVTDADRPTWKRTLTLGNDEKRREAARLTEELSITGRVTDIYGESLSKQQIYLLPQGAGHPGRGQFATKRRTGGQPETSPTNGAIAIKTRANGTFKGKLPRAGKWRLSVGMPGKAHWTQPKPTELTIGGPNHLVAVVPAQSQLTLRTELESDQRPSQVSAYVYDAQYAARLEAERQEVLALDRAAVDMKDERRKLKQQAMDDLAKDGVAGKTGRGGKASSDPRVGGSQKELNERAFEASMADFEERQRGVNREAIRAPLFDVGWRPVASARFNAQGEAVLRNVPSNDDVQFLFVRGRERITTATAVRLREGVRSVGSFDMPVLGGEGQQIMTRRGEATVRAQADAEAAASKLEVGATWTVGD